MTKRLLRPLILLAVLYSAAIKTQAQDFGDILSVGAEDANVYLENYLTPAVNSFGVGLANGWYNTAKTHKKLGVDLTLSINVANVPDADLMFAFSQSDYQNLKLRDGSGDMPDGTLLPTLVGGDAPNGSELYVPANTTVDIGGAQSITLEDDISFAALPGFDLKDVPLINGVPTPTLNLGIGLIKNTDLKIRWAPEQSFGDYSVKMFGVGVMHDIKQWIPGMKKLPFDLSVLFATTTMKSEVAIDVDIQNSDATTQTSSSFTGSGTGTFKTNATTFQVIASKKLAVLTPYVGVGFNAVKSNLDVTGDYTLSTENNIDSSRNNSQTVSDPIDLDFTSAGGGRLTVGMRLKLLILTIHADYTVQKYNTFTAGVGLSIR